MKLLRRMAHKYLLWTILACYFVVMFIVTFLTAPDLRVCPKGPLVASATAFSEKNNNG